MLLLNSLFGFKLSNDDPSPQVNWTALLDEVFRTSGVVVKPDQEILVGDMNYMKKLLKILDITPRRTLANYIQLSWLRRWLPDIPDLYTGTPHASLSPAIDPAEDRTTVITRAL